MPNACRFPERALLPGIGVAMFVAAGLTQAGTGAWPSAEPTLMPHNATASKVRGEFKFLPGPVRLPKSQKAEYTINLGMTGTWHDPDSPGRGVFLDVLPRRKEVVLGWVTFDENDPRWFSAQGPFDGSSADLTVYETQPKGPGTETVAVGAARLEFESCTSATLTHDVAISEPEEIHLSRLTPDVQCQTLRPQPRIRSVFQLKGFAYAFDKAGNSVHCELDMSYELIPELSLQGDISYTATLSGQVVRAVSDPKGFGPRFAFDVFVSDASIEWTPPFEIRLRGPGLPRDEDPFFQELTHFEGISQNEGRAVGAWTCAPVIADTESEHPGNDITAQGTWYIHPADRAEWNF